jgi:imidazolonepropionase-like amidohydrolase
MDAPRRALLGARNARDMLEAGFTAVRDVGNSGVNGDVALRDAIEDGWVNGPRMRVSTRALAPIGGQFNLLSHEAQNALIQQEYAVVTGYEEVLRAVRQADYDGADLIKVIVGVGARTFSPAEMKAIVDEAHRLGKKVAAHATDDAMARLAVDAGVDSVEHGYSLSEETMKDMAAKKIFLVPTNGIVDSYIHRSDLRVEDVEQTKKIVQQYVIASEAKTLRAAMRLGVPHCCWFRLLLHRPWKDSRCLRKMDAPRLCGRGHAADRCHTRSDHQCCTASGLAGSSGEHRSG